MIYPRLKDKSEVFSSILDGASLGDFRIENEYERNKEVFEEGGGRKGDSGLSKKYEDMASKSIDNLMKEQVDQEVRQRNIHEYFFMQKLKQDIDDICDELRDEEMRRDSAGES